MHEKIRKLNGATATARENIDVSENLILVVFLLSKES